MKKRVKAKKVIKKKAAKGFITLQVIDMPTDPKWKDSPLGSRHVRLDLSHPQAGRGSFDTLSLGRLCIKGLKKAGLLPGRRFKLVPLKARK
jgi:hypothetical protein